MEKQASYGRDCATGQPAGYIISHHLGALVCLACHPTTSEYFRRECQPLDPNPETGCLIRNRTDTSKCVKCTAGSILVNGVCQKCTADCFLYASDTVCSVCRQGWFLDHNTNTFLYFDESNLPSAHGVQIYVPATAMQTTFKNGTTILTPAGPVTSTGASTSIRLHT